MEDHEGIRRTIAENVSKHWTKDKDTRCHVTRNTACNFQIGSVPISKTVTFER